MLSERAISGNDFFRSAMEVLQASLEPTSSYATASYTVHSSFQKLCKQIEQESHPITVVMDFYDGKRTFGKLAVHGDGAWLVINLMNIVPNDWEGISPEDFKLVIFRLAQTFAHEMSNYEQYCRNWNFHRDTNTTDQDENDADLKSYAGDAARELLDAYGSREEVMSVLKTDLVGATHKSAALARVIDGNLGRDRVRKFLTDLYRNLN